MSAPIVESPRVPEIGDVVKVEYALGSANKGGWGSETVTVKEVEANGYFFLATNGYRYRVSCIVSKLPDFLKIATTTEGFRGKINLLFIAICDANGGMWSDKLQAAMEAVMREHESELASGRLQTYSPESERVINVERIGRVADYAKAMQKLAPDGVTRSQFVAIETEIRSWLVSTKQEVSG